MIETKIQANLTPDKSIYEKLGHGQHELHDAIAELIDNSYDARTAEQENNKEPLIVEIKCQFNKKVGSMAYATSIEIEDNAEGMDEETAKNCLVIAKTTREGKKHGRFGLGIKQSCLSLGKKFTIVTKRKGESKKYTLEFDNDKFKKKEKWEDFYIDSEEDKSDWHGTRITITDFWEPKLLYYLKLENLKHRFGWIFGPFIKKSNLKILVNQKEIEGKEIKDLELYPEKQINIDIDTPLQEGQKVKVNGWAAFRKRGGSTTGYSGFHLFRNGRLIKTWEHIGFRFHAELRNLVGELNLDDFPITLDKKDFIRNSPQWIELAGEEQFNEEHGGFEGYNTKQSKSAQALKSVLREYKQKVTENRKQKKTKKKSDYFESLEKKEFVSQKIQELGYDKALGKNIAMKEEAIKELIPLTFLEGKGITIGNNLYEIRNLSERSNIRKPYRYEIKNKVIYIYLNTNYPFYDRLKEDFDLYIDLNIIFALAEAVTEIKSEDNSKVIKNLEKLFEIYAEQYKKAQELLGKKVSEKDLKLFETSI